MSVEIISVGNEFIIQDYRHSRIATIAKILLGIGIDVDFVSSVSLQEARMEEILRQAIARSNLIFVTSGEISGEYDTIKKLLTRILKKRLLLNYHILDAIKEQYARRNEVMPRTDEKLALVPNETEILDNEIGPMPGFLFTQDNAYVILLPGESQEISAMMQQYILNRLDAKTFRGSPSKTLILKTCGMPVAGIKDKLREVMRDPGRQTFNYIADGEETSLIITLRGDIIQDVERDLAQLEQHIRKRLGHAVYGTGACTLEEAVGALLTEKHQTLALAESCTGGLISHKLTNISGSSAYFERGVVSYSNEAKMSLLDVSPNIIETHGAVSSETAVAMAEGVRWLARTSFGLSVTGIAGPSGDTPDKPVGLVYMALASEQTPTQSQRFTFMGDRLSIKKKAAQAALNMLRNHLLDC